MEGTNNDLSGTYANIGLSHADFQDYKNAEKAFQKAIEHAIIENNPYRKAEAINNLADVYLDTYRYQEAIATAKESLQLAESLPDLHVIYHSTKILSESYQQIRNFERAHVYLSRHLEIKDSLTAQTNLKEIHLIENQYLLKEQNRELSLHKQQLANAKIQESLQTQKNLLLWLALLGWTLIAVLIIFYQKQRLRRAAKEKELIQAKTEASQLKIK